MLHVIIVVVISKVNINSSGWLGVDQGARRCRRNRKAAPMTSFVCVRSEGEKDI